MKRILVLQGANMSALGKREPEIYGMTTAAELDALMHKHAEERGLKLEIFYTHHEGDAISRVYQAVEDGIEGVLINPAGFLHAGFALRDCLHGIRPPVVEVHMTNIDKRGRRSVTAEAAQGVITGFGIRSYLHGLNVLGELIDDRRASVAT
ncbi:3-dehydroquinate dehydratase (3-dehydroquinase) (Type II DHQase) [Bradyrhizobium sp. STM 3843]|uniref:type II 3-dehydroquinate dehydratase n=1 Tax=Bradyrhizobium sp. STM 3843 TaxID=551947 RepID=UPI0002403CD3|nr:type II 3-dehydroquinate dehydratase [Bradyrhizobium sp. STM 3843]CCE08510.1 3-dehydroquinate dehydratase (3-dehydroquinase) (Type II DHQase) [Bradyrhizobium sp. STM 3843]